MYNVFGIRHQTGNYEGRAFDNYTLFVNDPARQNENVQNYGTTPVLVKKSYGVKVKAAVLHQVVAPDKIEKLIGRSVEFYYDAHDNVSKVEVL